MATATEVPFRDRIKSLRRVKASQLIPNPSNWRRHPESQLNALRAVLSEIGFVGAELAIETPDGLMLIDGHARQELSGDQKIPVLVTDLTAEEADTILATFDPLGAMAESDTAALAGLLADLQTENIEVLQMVTELAEQAGAYQVDEVEAPTLANGDREPFRQMTFTVHDSQFEVIEDAMRAAKEQGGGNSDVNENSNGNAIAFICGAFNG